MSEFFVTDFDEDDLPPIVLPIPYEEEDEEAELAAMRARQAKQNAAVADDEDDEPIILPIPYDDEEAEKCIDAIANFAKGLQGMAEAVGNIKESSIKLNNVIKTLMIEKR